MAAMARMATADILAAGVVPVVGVAVIRATAVAMHRMAMVHRQPRQRLLAKPSNTCRLKTSQTQGCVLARFLYNQGQQPTKPGVCRNAIHFAVMLCFPGHVTSDGIGRK
jgi:hypothetical protein